MYMVYCKDPNCVKCKQALEGRISEETQSKYLKTVEELLSFELLSAAKEKAACLETCKKLKDEVQYKVNELLDVLKEREHDLCNQIDLEYATQVAKIDYDVTVKCTDKLLNKNSEPENLPRKFQPIFISDFDILKRKLQNFGFLGYDVEEVLPTSVGMPFAANSTAMPISQKDKRPELVNLNDYYKEFQKLSGKIADYAEMKSPELPKKDKDYLKELQNSDGNVTDNIQMKSSELPKISKDYLKESQKLHGKVADNTQKRKTETKLDKKDVKAMSIEETLSEVLNIKNPELLNLNDCLKEFEKLNGKIADNTEIKSPELPKKDKDYLKELQNSDGNVTDNIQMTKTEKKLDKKDIKATGIEETLSEVLNIKNPELLNLNDCLKEFEKLNSKIADNTEIKSPGPPKISEDYLKELQNSDGNVTDNIQMTKTEKKLDKKDVKATGIEETLSEVLNIKNPEPLNLNDCYKEFQKLSGKISDCTETIKTEMKLDKKGVKAMNTEETFSEFLNIGKEMSSMQYLLQVILREQSLMELGANNIKNEYPKPTEQKPKDTLESSSDEDSIEFINRNEVANVPSQYLVNPPLPPKKKCWFGVKHPCFAPRLPKKGVASEKDLRPKCSDIVKNKSYGCPKTLENSSVSCGPNAENGSINEQEQESFGVSSTSEDPSAALRASFLKYFEKNDESEWLAPKKSSEHLLSSENNFIPPVSFIDKKDVDLFEWLPKKNMAMNSN